MINKPIKSLYKPKMDLKEIVIELAVILQNTNPGYDTYIQDLINEMNNWGKELNTED